MTDKYLSKDEFSELYFEAKPEDLNDYEFLVAVGDLGDYEENIYALLLKDGQLFEYADFHCSCNGFTFAPTPVTAEYMRFRPAPYSAPDDFKALVEAALISRGF